MKDHIKKYVAEFIGTLVLVLFACGAATVLGCSTTAPNTAYLLTALAFGLSFVAMAYSIGTLSGCHLNPAVSLGMLMDGRLSVSDFIGYLIAQFAGGIAGAAILGYLAGWDCGFDANNLYQGDVLKSLIVEIILTFVFVLAFLGATSKIENRKIAGLVIGLALTLVYIFGIYFTGAGINPARSFGPALFAGGDAWSSLWVFIVAPLIGGAIAAGVWRGLQSPAEKN